MWAWRHRKICNLTLCTDKISRKKPFSAGIDGRQYYMLSFIDCLWAHDLDLMPFLCRDFAGILAIFAKVCHVFCHFCRDFLLSLMLLSADWCCRCFPRLFYHPRCSHKRNNGNHPSYTTTLKTRLPAQHNPRPTLSNNGKSVVELNCKHRWLDVSDEWNEM